MPKVTEAYSAARRQQIIDAAYRCFARKGFHQATMRDIYAEANLSAGAVYHYFDSKAAIIQASFEFDYERSLALFDAAKVSCRSVWARSSAHWSCCRSMDTASSPIPPPRRCNCFLIEVYACSHDIDRRTEGVAGPGAGTCAMAFPNTSSTA